MTDYEMKRIAKYQAEYLVQAIKQDDELLDLMFPPKMMGIEEASEFTGIPVNTLYQKIGQIPHQKVGKRLIFSDRALTRWIKRKPSVAEKIEIQPTGRKVM